MDAHLICAYSYLALRMYDIQTHLSVNGEQGLFAHHLLTTEFNTTIRDERRREDGTTYSENLPLHRATYSFRTVPAMNSLVS